MTASIVADAEEWVKSELAGQDGSHDWWHIARVRATALSLAREESLPESSMLTVELAALLHDVRDWKYSGDANAGAEAVSSWLEDHGHPADDIRSIVKIISNMGFKDELSSSSAPAEITPEFKVVQDADRLDAIGALGIARTFCYGGARGDPMHIPGVEPRIPLTKEQYVASSTELGRVCTVVNHFHEKLLRLKGMMKSESGRRRAEGRHEFMLMYLEQFHGEWDGDR